MSIRVGAWTVALGLLTMQASAAPEPVQLDWEHLIPGSEAGDDIIEQIVPRGVVQHGAMTPLPEDFGGLVEDYNGERVRMPGFVLPLDFIGTNVQEFLLVPYVGACIHVPPPPPNQIVYVTSEDGVEVNGMFEPVWVTGTFNTASISNDLADVGYQIEADSVEPYEE